MCIPYIAYTLVRSCATAEHACKRQWIAISVRGDLSWGTRSQAKVSCGHRHEAED